MPVAARKPLNELSTPLDHLYAQIEALPPNLRGEIIDGQLYAMSRPTAAHGAVCLEAMMALRPYQAPAPEGGGVGGWLFQIEPELHLASETFGIDIVVPDIAGWRRERLPKFPRTGYVPIAPDWVCEVLSPSTASQDKGPKRRIYHKSGVSHLWLLDPTKRTLEAQRRAGDFWVRVGVWRGDVSAHVEPFDGIEIDLARCWADLE